MKRETLAVIVFALSASRVMACQPLEADAWERSLHRVKENYDGAQFVVTADVVSAIKTKVAGNMDPTFTIEVERDTFRVVRSFKGKLRQGDTFVIDSGRTACGRGIKYRTGIFTPGKKWDAATPYPKRWLIYYTPPPVFPDSPVQLPPFEITSSPLSVPAYQASYDIDVLKQHAATWSGY